jgi:hypothetical protein
LVIVFDGHRGRSVERALSGQIGGEGAVGRRAQWRGRHQEKSLEERPSPGEIEDKLLPPEEIKDKLPPLRDRG